MNFWFCHVHTLIITTYVLVCVHTYTVHRKWEYSYTHACTCIHALYLYIHTMHTCMIHTYIHTYIHCNHTFNHACIKSNIHTNVHTCVQIRVPALFLTLIVATLPASCSGECIGSKRIINIGMQPPCYSFMCDSFTPAPPTNLAPSSRYIHIHIHIHTHTRRRTQYPTPTPPLQRLHRRTKMNSKPLLANALNCRQLAIAPNVHTARSGSGMCLE